MRDADVYEALRVVVNECGHSVSVSRIDGHLRAELERRGEKRRIRSVSEWDISAVLDRLIAQGLAMAFPTGKTPNHHSTYAPVEETVAERILEIDRQMIALKDEREHLVRVGIA